MSERCAIYASEQVVREGYAWKYPRLTADPDIGALRPPVWLVISCPLQHSTAPASAMSKGPPALS